MAIYANSPIQGRLKVCFRFIFTGNWCYSNTEKTLKLLLINILLRLVSLRALTKIRKLFSFIKNEE